MGEYDSSSFGKKVEPITRRFANQNHPASTHLFKIGDIGNTGRECRRSDKHKESTRRSDSRGPRDHKIPRQQKIAPFVPSHIKHHVRTPQPDAFHFGFFEKIGDLLVSLIHVLSELNHNGINFRSIMPAKDLIAVL